MAKLSDPYSPKKPCEDFVSLGNMYRINATGDPATLVEWWADPDGPVAGTSVTHDSVSTIFTNDGETLSHASGPADRSYIASTFSVEGSNATDFITGMGLSAASDSSGTDQAKLSAYFFLEKDALLRDGGTRTGERGGLWLNNCCSTGLELIEERTINTTADERGVFNGTVVPAGIHYAEAVVSDLSAFWNLTLEASFDGGETYGPLIGYQEKPEYECVPVIKCKDSGLLMHAYTDEVLDADSLRCEPLCAESVATTVDDEPSMSSVYRCYTKTEETIVNVPTDEAGTLAWNDSAQGTQLSNQYTFSVTDVGGLSGVNMDWDIDESQGGGYTFETGSSNGSTNDDNGGSYQFRAGFQGASPPTSGSTSDDDILAFDAKFSEPVCVEKGRVGDIDRRDQPNTPDETRWHDVARVVGFDADGNEVPVRMFFNNPTDLVIDDLGFAGMPDATYEQATDEDESNWLCFSTDGAAITHLRYEFNRGDGGWDVSESADPLYNIPNASSRMQIGTLDVKRTIEEITVEETTRQACATLDDEGNEIWQDAVTLEELTEEEQTTLADCTVNGEFDQLMYEKQCETNELLEKLISIMGTANVLQKAE